jgi:DNA-binding NtrC family response regulator
MPARIVLVHGDVPLLKQASAALAAAGHDVVAFADPMAALNALEAAQRVELLITDLEFGKDRLNGVALARMARMARYRRQAVRVLFVASPDNAKHAEGLGEFLATPVQVADIVAAVQRTMRAEV